MISGPANHSNSGLLCFSPLSLQSSFLALASTGFPFILHLSIVSMNFLYKSMCPGPIERSTSQRSPVSFKNEEANCRRYRKSSGSCIPAEDVSQRTPGQAYMDIWLHNKNRVLIRPKSPIQFMLLMGDRPLKPLSLQNLCTAVLKF